jgi:hypothetical protein
MEFMTGTSQNNLPRRKNHPLMFRLRRNNVPVSGSIVKVTRGLYSHYAIVEGIDPVSREWIVIHNEKGHGVEREFLANVIANSPWQVFNVPKNQAESAQRIETARELIGERYDLLTFNCEHFVRLVVHGNAESPQVQNFLLVAGLGALSFLGLRRLASA